MFPTFTAKENKGRGTRVRSTKSHAKPLSAPAGALNGDSRFDRRMQHILEHATEVFYEKGYEGASMRDLSRATGISLAGLYYYFESKEKLLYLIQKHTFQTVVDRLHRRLWGSREGSVGKGPGLRTPALGLGPAGESAEGGRPPE